MPKCLQCTYAWSKPCTESVTPDNAPRPTHPVTSPPRRWHHPPGGSRTCCLQRHASAHSMKQPAHRRPRSSRPGRAAGLRTRACRAAVCSPAAVERNPLLPGSHCSPAAEPRKPSVAASMLYRGQCAAALVAVSEVATWSGARAAHSAAAHAVEDVRQQHMRGAGSSLMSLPDWPANEPQITSAAAMGSKPGPGTAEPRRLLQAALVGAPNAGKSTLTNALGRPEGAGQTEHVSICAFVR